MVSYIWMGTGVMVSATVVVLIVKEIVRAAKASNNGEKGDYDFEID